MKIIAHLNRIDPEMVDLYTDWTFRSSSGQAKVTRLALCMIHYDNFDTDIQKRLKENQDLILTLEVE